MAHENSIFGKPLMIPLFFNEPDNEKLLTYDKAYMWGDAFLVSPVKERGKKKQTVYMPKGTGWTNFYTGKTYKGGKKHTISLSMNHIPVFVKGGSFIPMVKEAVNEINYSLNEYEMHYFSDPLVSKTSYQLYNDDGENPNAFEGGDYEFMNFWMEDGENSLRFTIQKTIAWEEFKTIKNQVDLVVHNLSKIPKDVKKNNKLVKKSDWSWDKNKKLLKISVTCSVEKEVIEIIVK